MPARQGRRETEADLPHPAASAGRSGRSVGGMTGGGQFRGHGGEDAMHQADFFAAVSGAVPHACPPR
jgi:hypothetical protein